MKVGNQHYRTIWLDADLKSVHIIDQTKLPFAFDIVRIDSLQKMVTAIKTMQVRGAPLIGAAAAYGMALAMNADASDANLQASAKQLLASRPTAVNLRWAVSRMANVIKNSGLQGIPMNERAKSAWAEAQKIADEDVAQNTAIGKHGLALIQKLYQQKTINILTHCNAGWLATVDVGTALAPIYAAHDAGLKMHVWVDETRPRNQGAALTAWELAQHGVPHTVICDNAGGHLMQNNQVDMVIVGADRVTAKGDVCNKIGTYLKALAAFDNNIPFYAAVPSPTIDWTIKDGQTEIEIEQRDADEVCFVQGITSNGQLQSVRILPQQSAAANPAFDVTPARIVTGIITESGLFAPQRLSALNNI
jgi:methylthioribose-1-phosphate isomerase